MSHPPTKKSRPAKAPAEPKAVKLSRARLAFLIVAGCLVALVGAGTIYAFTYNQRYLPRTVVGGVAIGGLNRGQAVSALEARRATFLDQPLQLGYQDKQWEIKPSDLGTTVAFTSQLDQLWTEEKSGDWWSNLKKLLAAPLSTRFADVSVAALSEEGKHTLDQQVLANIETALQETSLKITKDGAEIVPGKAGERLDAAAFEDGLAKSFKQGDAKVVLALAPANLEVTPELAEAAHQRALQLLAKPLTLKLDSQTFPVDATTLATWLYTDVAQDAAGQATGLRLLLTHFFTDSLQGWEEQVNKAPLNARLGVTGGTVSVVKPDEDGLQVDETATVQAVEAYLNGKSSSGAVNGVVKAQAAEVRPDTYVALGLTQLVGSGTTDFSGSPVNRTFNIKKGAASINQVLVKPGGTFSTLGTLGPIDNAHGYLNELVIKDNRTVPDAGGGLCQVSTTLFRSVLNAGLPIVERQNHAYRVSYYERGTGPGLDATIFEPSPDFKWKNDFASNLFVQSHVDGTKLTFDIYGTKDGRVSSITPPTILATYPVGPAIYADSDTLPKGTVKQIEHAHDGAKTSVTYTVTKNGQSIYNKTFISVYKAWPAQYLVGTAEVPTPEPTPTPSP